MLSQGLPRWADLAIASVCVLIAAPAMLMCALAVALTSPGPVLFRQTRVGRNGALFTLYKFRSMRVNVPGHGVTASNDPRITPIGRCLRRTKLDELPQLFNVLRGQMALVGYRPELPEYVDLSDARWRAVIGERPGLVAPASIIGTDEEKLLAYQRDVDGFYRTTLLHHKLTLYREFQKSRTWKSDLLTLASTWKALH